MYQNQYLVLSLGFEPVLPVLPDLVLTVLPVLTVLVLMVLPVLAELVLIVLPVPTVLVLRVLVLVLGIDMGREFTAPFNLLDFALRLIDCAELQI